MNLLVSSASISLPWHTLSYPQNNLKNHFKIHTLEFSIIFPQRRWKQKPLKLVVQLNSFRNYFLEFYSFCFTSSSLPNSQNYECLHIVMGIINKQYKNQLTKGKRSKINYQHFFFIKFITEFPFKTIVILNYNQYILWYDYYCMISGDIRF